MLLAERLELLRAGSRPARRAPTEPASARAPDSTRRPGRAATPRRRGPDLCRPGPCPARSGPRACRRPRPGPSESLTSSPSTIRGRSAARRPAGPRSARVVAVPRIRARDRRAARRDQHPMSSRRASGRVNGRTKKKPTTSVTKPGRQQQGAADQHQRRRRPSSRPGSWPVASARCSAAQRPAALVLDAARRRAGSRRSAARRSAARPISLPDLDDHVDLDDRDEQRRATSRSQPMRAHPPVGEPARRTCRPAHRAAPQTVTRHSASRTIAPLILDSAALALDERDRHLDDPEARPDRAPGQVDLEAVALRTRRRPGRSPPASRAGTRGSRRSRRAAATPSASRA